jgi:hypothetical protein
VNSINNHGTLSSVASGAGAAVLIYGTLGSLTNQSDGLITSTGNDIFISNSQVGTIVNYGTMVSTGAAAILFDNKGVSVGSVTNGISNAASGLIQGGTVGGTVIAIDARLAVADQLINTSGSIIGDILQGTGKDVLNVNAGRISGDIIGQTGSQGTANFTLGNGKTYVTDGNILQVDTINLTSGTLSVSAGNTITASTATNYGVHMTGTATGLSNSGTITATGAGGIAVDASNGNTVDVIINNATGLIDGDSRGLDVKNANVIQNAGSINSASGIGVNVFGTANS